MPEGILNQIKIVLADDHQFFRASFKTIVQAHDHKQQIVFVAEATNGAELIDCVVLHQPDIVVSDIKMPKIDGIEAAKIIKDQFPHVRVIALSEMEDETTVLGMLQAGASGYLVKSSTVEEIMDAINKVYNGKHYYSGAISDKVYRRFMQKDKPAEKNNTVELSGTELSIVQLICQQLSDREIAAALSLKVYVVKEMITGLLKKTHSKTTVGIALYAMQNSIVKRDELTI